MKDLTHQILNDALVRLNELAKAEGSRGGHIIGHTKSGKPIYSRGHKSNKSMAALMGSTTASASARRVHSKYTAADHLDAARAHGLNADLAIGTGMEQHQQLERAHEAAYHDLKAMGATKKSALCLTDLLKAEGARGGHIIGHSKSGRPIYAAKGNKRELLHKLSRGENHVSVAASLKHGHYIGMFGGDHFKRADRHDLKATSYFAKAKKAGSVKDALKLQKAGQAHADLSRAHRMMGQLSSDVRMPDHIREAAAMSKTGSHDKLKLTGTKQRYFSTLGAAGHQRAVSRHQRLLDAANTAGHKATAEHHDTMVHAHKAMLHSFYGDKGSEGT